MKADKSVIRVNGSQGQKGVALVIILAFLVLLTGVIVAFSSRATTERQVSNSSAAQAKADLLARSAMDVIAADLKQEIVNRSVKPAATPAAGVSIYVPTSNLNMVPKRDPAVNALTGANAIPNLIRVSGTGAPPPPAVATGVASAVLSTAASTNGRSISLARWNSHYLIPRDPTKYSGANASNPGTDPIPAFASVVPSWVMVTNQGPKVLTAPSTATVGRYAYAIYDEGGLLDVNVAGYPLANPAPAGTPVPPYKASLAFADLTRVPAASGSSIAQALVNNLVGWRNYASVQPGGTLGNYTFNATSVSRYYNFALTGTTGSMTVNPVPFPSPATATSRTDQMFTSRQALIRFSRAAGMIPDSLQYLTTFTRDLNQPSYVRLQSTDSTKTLDYNSNVPKVLPPTKGGNNATGLDDKINPSFLGVRVQATKAGGRNDGTDLVKGEPLAKTRFALVHRIRTTGHYCAGMVY